jgi:phosphotransacetylase/acyl dehydratase
MSETVLENKVFDEITIGESARIVRRLTKRDIELFAVVTGDLNPTHIDQQFAKEPSALVAHRLLGGALFSAVLGTKLPGPGTIYHKQELSFFQPMHIDDVIEARVTVCGKDPIQKIVFLDCVAVNQRGEEIVKGVAQVFAPTEKVSRPFTDLPEVEVVHHDRLRQLIENAQKHPALRTAVIHPCDQVSLEGAIDAAKENLIVPVFVGPESKIRAAADAARIDISGYEIVSVPHSHAAAEMGAVLARDGKVGALMKGSLHSDEYLSAVLGKNSGLRTDRRMSHVFAMDVPTYKWPLLITDAALNIAPDLPTKRDICQNAVYLAHDIGLEKPKAALLAAAETVSFGMPATMDAAILCKMADRGQIEGGVFDGPLAFDNAISMEAVRIKKITSLVAGQADLLIAPNIEAGNMMVKQLVYLAAAVAAGIVVGAKVPVMLTSRADPANARMASAALAVLAAEGDRKRAEATLAGKA